MSTILITGGNGLVGSALKSISRMYPQYNWIFMERSICDLTHWEQTITYFGIIKPTYVLHLAAKVGGLYKNLRDRLDMFEDNLLINTHVLRACAKVGVKKVISVLSTCIFPNTNIWLDETMVHDGPPDVSNYGYAYAKRMLDIHSRLYREQGYDYYCVIPCNIYGPCDNFSLEDGHVIPALIHKCHLANINNTPLKVRGSGKAQRQFIHSMDVAKLLALLLIQPDKGENMILANEEIYDIADIAGYIADQFNVRSVLFDVAYEDGQMTKNAINGKITSKFPLFSFTPIDEGIRTTVDWFKQHYPLVRK
jgi:GDP-L-fucose synthase